MKKQTKFIKMSLLFYILSSIHIISAFDEFKKMAIVNEKKLHITEKIQLQGEDTVAIIRVYMNSEMTVVREMVYRVKRDGIPIWMIRILQKSKDKKNTTDKSNAWEPVQYLNDETNKTEKYCKIDKTLLGNIFKRHIRILNS